MRTLMSYGSNDFGPALRSGRLRSNLAGKAFSLLPLRATKPLRGDYLIRQSHAFILIALEQVRVMLCEVRPVTTNFASDGGLGNPFPCGL